METCHERIREISDNSEDSMEHEVQWREWGEKDPIDHDVTLVFESKLDYVRVDSHVLRDVDLILRVGSKNNPD